MLQMSCVTGKATDEQVTEPDWMGMLAMCDLVRQQEVCLLHFPFMCFNYLNYNQGNQNLWNFAKGFVLEL